MTNCSTKSANYPCQKCQNKKTIYLTFDDGPEAGTRDIYKKLNELGVPATFFMVGENVIASETGKLNISNIQSVAPGFFKRVFDNPLFEIGNHSQTQSHQFYDNYYKLGLRINPDTLAPSATSQQSARRSVLVDFELSSVAFTHALNGTPSKYFQDRSKILDYGYRGDDVLGLFSNYGITYFRFLTGRMPGTNTWRLDGAESSWLSGERDDEANDLAKNKYKIFGWDTEWKMTNATYKDDPDNRNKSVMSVDVRNEHTRDEDGWWDGYYNEANVGDDHLKETVDILFSQTQSKLERWRGGGTCVILLHDRQFRSNPDGTNSYIEKLVEFIEKCKGEGYEFDVLENYQA